MQGVFQVKFFIKVEKFHMVMDCLGIRFDKSHAGETLQDGVNFLQKYQGLKGKDQSWTL